MPRGLPPVEVMTHHMWNHETQEEESSSFTCSMQHASGRPREGTLNDDLHGGRLGVSLHQSRDLKSHRLAFRPSP